ncbi:MAG: cell division protein ZapA [Rickettsiales bacterium]|nr:cell division protein ZapA [Rickettsiales bacterium]
MTEVEISIGKSKYKINCQESEKEKLLSAANQLNQRVNQLALSFRSLDEKTLLVISALTIEEELQNKITSPNQENKELQPISDQDIFDAVSENMENISYHLEKLTKKIRNY